MGGPDLGTPVQTTPRGHGSPRGRRRRRPTWKRQAARGWAANQSHARRPLYDRVSSRPRRCRNGQDRRPPNVQAEAAVGGAAAAPHVHVMLVDWGAGQAGCPAAWPNTSLGAAMKEVFRCEQITLHTWVGLAPSVDGLERKGGGFLEGKLDLKTATQRPCLRSLRAHLPHGFQICPTIVFLKVRRGGPVGYTPPQSRRPERPASHTCTLGDNRQSAWDRSRAPPGRCRGMGEAGDAPLTCPPWPQLEGAGDQGTPRPSPRRHTAVEGHSVPPPDPAVDSLRGQRGSVTPTL